MSSGLPSRLPVPLVTRPHEHLAPPPVADPLADVRCRMFLADAPLQCLAAPPNMVPVCTADLGYRQYYTPDVVARLRSRFGLVEAWCDCRPSGGTAYPVAQQMVIDLGLNGPAWGQCENAAEFGHGYGLGCRRMVGNLSALGAASLALVATGEVHVTAELYRNVQPNEQPDWRNANAGVGGNTIACYASSSEGATYLSVAQYKQDGMYVMGRDSVYGVGLTLADWRAL